MACKHCGEGMEFRLPDGCIELIKEELWVRESRRRCGPDHIITLTFFEFASKIITTKFDSDDCKPGDIFVYDFMEASGVCPSDCDKYDVFEIKFANDRAIYPNRKMYDSCFDHIQKHFNF